ncbi:MAG: orotidine 5'-phosphate decarboxylase [Candidatus Bathyarchaeia archaeon]
MRRASETKGSPIVLALDLAGGDAESLASGSIRILEETAPYVCALKLNSPMVLRLCLGEKIRDLIRLAHEHGLMTIMDAKLNDVSHINLAAAAQYFDAGFDALIASPFIGWEGGLDSTFKQARERGKGVILLVHMSHRGAAEGYGQSVVDPATGQIRPQFIVFAEKALAWGADGVVVGATHVDKISAVYRILEGEIPIYSPGLLTQGGSVKDAAEAGADYLIVGRSICNSENPGKTARSIRDEAASYRAAHRPNLDRMSTGGRDRGRLF